MQLCFTIRSFFHSKGRLKVNLSRAAFWHQMGGNRVEGYLELLLSFLSLSPWIHFPWWINKFISIYLSFCHFCSLTHKPAAELNSPFLPEFGCPGGLSVTEPANKERKMTCAKQRPDSGNNSFWTIRKHNCHSKKELCFIWNQTGSLQHSSWMKPVCPTDDPAHWPLQMRHGGTIKVWQVQSVSIW